MVCAVAVALASPVVARAQQRDPAAAEALFRAGRDAAEQKDWALAREKFRESHRLDPAPGTLLNIALCEESLGELASAWQHYQQVLSELDEDDDRVPFAKGHFADISGRVPRLTLRAAPGAPPDMVVARDGIEIGGASLGVALPVNPGLHVVRVTATGRQAREYRVAVKESATQTLDIGPGDPAAPVASERQAGGAPIAPPTPDTPGRSSPRRTAGFVALGVGAAGIAVGAVTGALVFAKKGEVNDACAAPDSVGRRACTSQSGVDASHAGQAFATTSTVAFIVGATSLAVGVILLVTDRHPSRTSKQGAVSLAGSRFRF